MCKIDFVKLNKLFFHFTIMMLILLCFPVLVWGLNNIQPLLPSQLIRINQVMMKPDLSCRSRHLIEAILYKRYEYWAIKMGSNFKKQHYYKCKHIPYHEMSIYSRVGLLNAIRRYNPTKQSSMFHLYAIHHIRGQLYKGMTELSPIINASKKQLRNKGTIYERAGHNYDAIVNKHPSTLNINKPTFLWEHIEETADPFTRRCITYKFDYDFNTIRSNLEVAQLMESSEETVRKAILMYFSKQNLGIIIVKSSHIQ